MSDRVAVETIKGEKLLGIIIDDNANSPFGNGNGILLKRDRHTTYLAKEEILKIRQALSFEKEIDGN